MSDMPQASAAVPETSARPSATPTQILERADALYRKDRWAYLSVTLVACACSALVLYSLVEAFGITLPSRRSVMETPLSLVILFAAFATVTLAYGLAKGTLSLITAATLSGRTPSAAEAFVALLAVMPRLFIASAVLVVIGCLTVSILLPGILASLFFPFVIPAIAVERKSFSGAMAYNARKVFSRRPPGHPRKEYGNFRRSLELSASALSACLFRGLFVIAVVIPLSMFPDPVADNVGILLIALCTFLFAHMYPCFAIADTLLHFDIRSAI